MDGSQQGQCSQRRLHPAKLQRTFHFHQLPEITRTPLRSSTCMFLLHSAKTLCSHKVIQLYYVVRLCAHTQRYTDRSRHFKAFAPLWGKEAAWQTPACRIKTYHLLSFSLLQTRGFCMGLAEPGLGMLFIYFICYQKLGRHKAFFLFAKRQKPLVRRTTIRCKLRSDGFCCLDAESLWFML